MAQYQPLQPRREPTQQKKKSQPASPFSQAHSVSIGSSVLLSQPGLLQRDVQSARPEPLSLPRLSLQPKLTVGAVNDPYEQEADRVARQVVNQLHRLQLQAQTLTPIADIQAKGELGGGTVSPEVERGITQDKGGAQEFLTPGVQQGAPVQHKASPTKPTAQLTETLQPQRLGLSKPETASISQPGDKQVAQFKALTRQPTGLMQPIPTQGLVQRVTTAEDADTQPQNQDASTDKTATSQDNASGNAPAQQDDLGAKSKVEEEKNKVEEAKKKSEEAKKKILGKNTLTKFSETGNYDKMIDPDAAEELAYKIVTRLNGLIRAREIRLIKSDHGTTVEFLMAQGVDMMKLKAFPSIHSKKNKGLIATYEGCTKKEDTTSKRRFDDDKTYYRYGFRFGMFAKSKVTEDWKDVGTATAGLGSAAGHADLPDLMNEDITDKDAYTIYDKVQLMLTALKEGGDEVPGQILEIVSSSIFGTVLSFGFALKRFADLDIYKQRLEGLQASQEKLSQKAQQPNAQVDAGLQEGITYAIEKVKKLMGSTLVKAVASLVQGLSRVFTVLFSAIFPPAAIISLCAELTALTARAADFFYRKGKGIVKIITGKRGVKRLESAESIYSAAIGGDSEALGAIRALNIKTIIQQTTDLLSQKITQKNSSISMTSIDARSAACKKIIDPYSRKDGTKWMGGVNLVEKVLTESIIKQGLKNVLKEKNITIDIAQITSQEIRAHTTPNELMAMVNRSILDRDMQQVNDENLVVYLQRFNQYPAVRKNFVQGLANQMKSSDYT